MFYFAITLLSICSCFVGFLLEGAESNVRHVQNGRLPDASVALLPAIPVIPLIYLLTTWALNQLGKNGFALAAAYAFLSMAIRYWRYRRVKSQLNTLLAECEALQRNAPTS